MVVFSRFSSTLNGLISHCAGKSAPGAVAIPLPAAPPPGPSNDWTRRRSSATFGAPARGHLPHTDLGGMDGYGRL